MEEQNPVRHPTVLPNSCLWIYASRCQNRLARSTMRPVDYDEYVRITRDLHDEEPFNVECRRRLGILLLQDPDYRHLRVYWNVLYKNFTGEVQLEDNPLLLYPVALFGVLAVIRYLLQLRSRRNMPRRRDIALEFVRFREESLRELRAIRRALLRIGVSVNGVGNADDAATISTAVDLINRF